MNNIRNGLLILSIAITLNSCILTNNILTDKRIDKDLITEANGVKVITTVEKYSRSKEWFYGKIKIENKTNKDFRFNFNQNLRVDGQLIYSDWNIYPISYAQEAFRVKSNAISEWTVVWKFAKVGFSNKKTIMILPDVEMEEYK